VVVVGLVEELDTRILELHPDADRQAGPDYASDDREEQVHRTDVLVVRRIHEPSPSGWNRVLVVAMIVVSCSSRCHFCCPLNRLASVAFVAARITECRRQPTRRNSCRSPRRISSSPPRSTC